jgi:peptidoglycan/LPS O-acetylase OafA/YrhL
MRRPDIPVLTSLRFPAAFAIVLFHFLAYTTCPRWIWEGFDKGVSFFYVLSGFILYYNYEDLKDRSYFWIARLARIWPVHITMLVMVLIFEPWDWLLGHASWQITLPANILLVHAWLPFKGSALSFNGVSWSLSAEAFFYLCFPFLLVAMKRWGLLPVTAGAFLVGLVIVVSATIFWPSNAAFFSSFNPVCRVFEFVLGMATCKLWLDRQAFEPRQRSWLVREVLVLLLSLVLVVGLPIVLGFIGQTWPAPAWLATEICAFGFAALIWVFAHQGGAISRTLSHRLFTWSGEISFALYMCHQLILRRLVLPGVNDASQALRLFCAVVFLSLILSAVLFHLVETPARHAIVGAYKRLSLRPARALK